MANEPKLYALFGPDGKVVADKHSHRGGVATKKWVAWFFAGMGLSSEQRRAKRAGYTCREVRIVPVEEPRTIPGTRITVGQMLAQIAEMGSVDEFASQFSLDTTTVRDCLLRLSDEVGT